MLIGKPGFREMFLSGISLTRHDKSGAPAKKKNQDEGKSVFHVKTPE
jgi:hypothetical protein